MKNKKVNIVVISVIFVMIALFCWKHVSRTSRMGNNLQLNLIFGKVEYYYDDHGGFHGDGETDAVISFNDWTSKWILRQIEDSDAWEPLPLPQKVYQLAHEYRLADSFHATFAEFVGLPKIENGYWCFLDRDDYHNGVGELYNYEALQKMEEQKADFWPFNFVIAMYDVDTQTLYYFQHDI